MTRVGSSLLAFSFAVVLAGCDSDPRSRAQRIGSQEQLIGGPKAVGQIGDFILENDQVRVIISDKGPGRVNTPYGGSLVDADIVRIGPRAGNDQLAEVLPGFLFSAINPTEVVVTNDGRDGKAAAVTVRGTGEDLVQSVALLNSALLFSPSLGFEQTYRLEPGKNYVEIETKITNKTVGMHPLPYLEPAKLRDAGLKIPGVENLEFSVPMGQLLLLGGEQKLFAPGTAGFNIRFAIEDSYATAAGFPAFPGLVVDYLATKGDGVSYGFTIPDQPSNYPKAFADLYKRQQVVTNTSVLLPFTYAGVAAAYTANPPEALAPGQSFSFSSYFVIGNGDAASILTSIQDIRKATVGRVAGVVTDKLTGEPVADASVMFFDDAGKIVTQSSVDDSGFFQATLEPGEYSYVIVTDDRAPTEKKTFRVGLKQVASLRVELDPPANLVVSVLDESGRRAPVKVTLVGNFEPSNQGKVPRTFLFNLALGERERPTAFDGGTRFIEKQWNTANGTLSVAVRPGRYDLVITRGPEYGAFVEPVELVAGKFVRKQVRLQREFSTPGWVSADSHLHAQPSTDSDTPLDQRVISCAAEGLEVAVATDHNSVTDYAPYIARNRLEEWLVGLPGIELTTFEAGHYNGFPLKVDAASTRGGEFVWTKRGPQELFDQLRNDLAAEKGKAIVQVNHPRQAFLGYWAQYFVDSETAEPYTPTGVAGVFAPFGDEFRAEKYSHDYDAVELITGKRSQDIHTFVAPNPLPPGPFPDPQPVAGQIVRSKDGRPSFPGTVETWFTMLDRGHRATGMGASDVHGLLGDEPGYPRTYLRVGVGKDGPGGFSQADVVEAIRNHRAIATNSPFIEVTVGDGQIGDVVRAGPRVVVKVKVRAPSWAPIEKVILYSNSVKVGEQAVPAQLGTDYDGEFTLDLTKDSWVVVEALGSKNMFPQVAPQENPGLDASVLITALSSGLDLGELPLASKLKPPDTTQVKPYGITNPIWIDVDGGGWTPPKPPLPKLPPQRAAGPQNAPDVRAAFQALDAPNRRIK